MKLREFLLCDQLLFKNPDDDYLLIIIPVGYQPEHMDLKEAWGDGWIIRPSKCIIPEGLIDMFLDVSSTLCRSDGGWHNSHSIEIRDDRIDVFYNYKLNSFYPMSDVEHKMLLLKHCVK